MEQLCFFDPVNRAISGAIWWVNNVQCRNWNDYYQVREGGSGSWQFVIYAFGDEDAVVYCLDHKGALTHKRVPMDDKDRLVINGKRYGRKYWQH